MTCYHYQFFVQVKVFQLLFIMKKKLEQFFEKKIIDGRIEGIFSIIREVSKEIFIKKN